MHFKNFKGKAKEIRVHTERKQVRIWGEEQPKCFGALQSKTEQRS